jgi:dihydrofolate reductase|tara:strand:- start:6425 stop:6928 length:504 start_codon:yes stop_codon:yes gene_type:complete
MIKKISLSLIVAMAKNRVIGINNQLPWQLPEDLKYFKSVTMNKPIVMGRKTFESIGRPLPGRLNIVITRNTNWCFNGVKVASSLNKAKDLAISARDFKPEIMIIGGSEIYNSTIEHADRLYITRVEDSFEGDTFFPMFDEKDWNEIERKNSQQKTDIPYFFQVLERI